MDSKTRREIDDFSISRFLGTQMAEDGGGYEVIVPYPKRAIKNVTDSVCDIAKDLGWSPERRAIRYEELPGYSEVLAVGTAGA